MMHDPGANPSSTYPSLYRSSSCVTSPSSSSSCCFAKKKPQKPIKNTRDDSVLCCCCTCPTPTSSASVLTCLGVCIIVLIYTLLGAFAFMALEGSFSTFKDPETSVAASQPNPSTTDSLAGAEIRSKTVEKLWSITEDLNILYKDNWTRLATQEVLEFQDMLVRAMRGSTGVNYRERDTFNYPYGHQHRWSFSSSFLYSLTLITTIGYGNVTPRTPGGKLVTIIYALLGIPLMLVYLSTVGDVLARNFRRLYTKMCRSSKPSKPKVKNQKPTPSLSGSMSFKTPPNHIPDVSSSKGYFGDIKSNDSIVLMDCVDPSMSLGGPLGGLPPGIDTFSRKRYYHRGCLDQVRVPIIVCMIIILIYMLFGAVLFNKTENWSLLEGSYFCFTSLSTVGFGDLYPGQHASNISAQAEEIALCICSIYILIGMAVIAMCFNLVQDEIIVLVRKFNRACGGQTRTHIPHRTIDDIDPIEEVSMSVVS